MDCFLPGGVHGLFLAGRRAWTVSCREACVDCFLPGGVHGLFLARRRAWTVSCREVCMYKTKRLLQKLNISLRHKNL